jgi:hypothetical protein
MGVSDQDNIKARLAGLASAVIAAIRSGDADARKKLIAVLNGMNSQMPGISEDTAQAKEFLSALTSLLEGNPAGPETLSGVYASLYRGIVEKALAPDNASARAGKDQELREFLTKLSAAVVLVMRDGTDEDKKDLAQKLREIAGGTQEGAREFVIALAEILEGGPEAATKTLPGPYAGFYAKILATIAGKSA